MRKYVLHVAPAGKGRPRFSKQNSRAYTPEKTRNKTAEIKFWLHQLGAINDGDGPLAVSLDFYFTKPKSAPKSRIYPTVKPDIDNLVKLVLDSANGVLYDDDKQIVECNVKKLYGEERIEITLRTL